MTNPKKKPAPKGVPMPTPKKRKPQCWIKFRGGRHIPGIHLQSSRELAWGGAYVKWEWVDATTARQARRVAKWLLQVADHAEKQVANPQQPKVVRR